MSFRVESYLVTLISGFTGTLAKYQEKAVSEKREDNIPLKERISNQLVKKEVETFYAAFLVWTIVMLIMSYYRLASAHLPLLFIIFPLIIQVVIWDNVLTAKTSHENVGAFLFMYLLATLVPVQFCMYLTFAMFDVFMPIMGRAGTQTPPDVFISVLCAFGVVLLTSYMVSTVYVLGNLKLPAIFLLFVTTVGMVISLSGLSFPYSAINQCPKRVFFQPKRHLLAKSNLLDFVVAAHYIHGKESSSPFLKEVMQAIPDWVFANDWVDTYKSWSYTT